MKLIGAVDIGGTKIAVGVVNWEGEVLVKAEIPTLKTNGPQSAVDAITHLLNQSVSLCGSDIEGIGIGCTGPVYPFTGLVGLTDLLPGWEGFNLVKALEVSTEKKTCMENDADAAALGEWAWGCGKATQNFILATIGTGIGVGLVLGGKLYRGVDGSHPEIGHHFIDPAGPTCSCGGRGCWESLASGPALEKWAASHHPESLYRSGRELCVAARNDDIVAQAAIDRTAYYMGLGIANLVTSFVPEMIALAGGLMTSAELFIPKIESTIKEMCAYVPYESVKIIPVPPDSQAGLRGAAQVWVINQKE